jgi:hypothetical protein
MRRGLCAEESRRGLLLLTLVSTSPSHSTSISWELTIRRRGGTARRRRPPPAPPADQWRRRSEGRPPHFHPTGGRRARWERDGGVGRPGTTPGGASPPPPLPGGGSRPPTTAMDMTAPPPPKPPDAPPGPCSSFCGETLKAILTCGPHTLVAGGQTCSMYRWVPRVRAFNLSNPNNRWMEWLIAIGKENFL